MNLNVLNPIKWKKSILFVLLTGFILVWIAFVDTFSLKTRWELHQRKTNLAEQTDRLNNASLELEKKINRLENDVLILEKIAREEYGMRKPGETVYKIRRQ